MLLRIWSLELWKQFKKKNIATLPSYNSQAQDVHLIGAYDLGYFMCFEVHSNEIKWEIASVSGPAWGLNNGDAGVVKNKTKHLYG